ncbi:response regulator transcription factor [Vibrio diabolicus]
MDRILLLEDELFTSRIIQKKILERYQHVHVHQSFDLGSAIQLCVQYKFSVIIMDLRLPSGSSLDCLHQVRKLQSCPVIIYTNSERRSDELTSLNRGAVDFIMKERGLPVLLARLERYLLDEPYDIGALNASSVSMSGITLDIRSNIISNEKNANSCELTNQQASILWYMFNNFNRVVFRDELSKAVDGIEYDGASRKLDLSVSRIRKKCADVFLNELDINTIRGKGYILTYYDETLL